MTLYCYGCEHYRVDGLGNFCTKYNDPHYVDYHFIDKYAHTPKWCKGREEIRNEVR